MGEALARGKAGLYQVHANSQAGRRRASAETGIGGRERGKGETEKESSDLDRVRQEKTMQVAGKG